MLFMNLLLSDLMAFYLSGSLLSVEILSFQERVKALVYSSLGLKLENVEKGEATGVTSLSSSTDSRIVRIFLINSCIQP